MTKLTDKPVEDLSKDEAAKKHSLEENVKEHTIQEQAKERAENPVVSLNTGTPFDWEDLEDYQKELKRMDREPPKSNKS